MKWQNRLPRLPDELSRLRELAPHDLLNISSEASVQDIKHAYRQMAKLYHPDRADAFMRKHNEQVIKLVISAYKSMMANFPNSL